MEKLTGKDKHTVAVESRSTYKYDIKTNNCKKRTVQKEDIENDLKLKDSNIKQLCISIYRLLHQNPHRNCKLKNPHPPQKNPHQIYTCKRKEILKH